MAFTSAIPPGASISRNIRSTRTRTSIATGDRAASGASSSPNTKGLGSGGVVVEVVVNERAEHARMFVQKSDKTLTVYPY